MKVLPPPDWLEFSGPDVCLITDDGSQTTVQLAQALTRQGSTVVVLSFPLSWVPDRLPLPEGIHRVELGNLSEAHLHHQIATLMTTYGSIDTFIHLHPRSPLPPETEFSASETDQAILRQVFLLAKHLKQTLTTPAQNGRSGFLSAAWLDGTFGLSRQTDFSAIAAGLFGLTKTLSREWPSVFCRAIDLSPTLNPDQAVQAILAELRDPNWAIAEVGYSDQGRTTLTC